MRVETPVHLGGEPWPSKLQGSAEKNRGEGGLTQCPGGTTVAWRGSARAATTAPSQGKAPMTRRQDTTPTSTRSRRGKGQTTWDEDQGHHGRDPRHMRQRSRGHKGGNRPDLLDRQERHHEIYRLRPISAANSGGGGRNRARRRRGDAVARARARGRREVNAMSARSVWPSHLVGFDHAGQRWQGGPDPTGGPSWQVGLGRF
jgi:hypothetical protein